jgi:Cu-processing system permease protein
MTAIPTHATAGPASMHLGWLASVGAFARREFREALVSRWFILYTIAFTVLAVAVAFVSLAGVGSHGFAGFGRTTAGLLNLIMLVVPLIALTAGAGAIAGERERGTLLYLLAQPVSRLEILAGKFTGLALALCCSLALGFGVSAAVLLWRTGGAGLGAFAVLVAFSCALAIAMLAVGLLISVLSRSSGVATGIGLFTWLALVFLSDLGLMAGTILFRLRVQEVFAVGIANPLQAFKMAVLAGMNTTLDVLGPVGVYATQTIGSHLLWVLAAVLVAWGVLPFLAAAMLFTRRGQG